MTVWEFDVGVTTHDLLHQGVLVDHYTHVQIEAPTHLEASELAIQMAWTGPEHEDRYVTECLPRI